MFAELPENWFFTAKRLPEYCHTALTNHPCFDGKKTIGMKFTLKNHLKFTMIENHPYICNPT
jgi:hypothetical protein